MLRFHSKNDTIMGKDSDPTVQFTLRALGHNARRVSPVHLTSQDVQVQEKSAVACERCVLRQEGGMAVGMEGLSVTHVCHPS